MSSIHSDGLPFRLCLYFTANRGAALFTGDICRKWKTKPEQLSDKLAAARRNGWLSVNRIAGEQQAYYSAGPKLEAALKDLA